MPPGCLRPLVRDISERMLRYALPIVLVLTGCGISVNHSSTGPDTYLVTADGKNHHSHGELSRAASDRAMKLCGPAGYQIQSQGGGTQVQGHANKDGAYVGSKGSVAIYVVCNRAASSANTAPAVPVNGSPPEADRQAPPSGY